MAIGDDDLNLADMLESYPNAMTPGFQTLITAKKEFRELASEPNEKLPPGLSQPFKHQKFTQRFLRAYDDLLIASETGSGKSFEFGIYGEWVLNEIQKAKKDPRRADEKASHFKKVVILVKGNTHKNEIKNQIVCKFSGDKYINSTIVKKAERETSQKTNITNVLKSAGYVITSYEKFHNTIKKDYPTEKDIPRLIEDYSDTIFWIDEAHNLFSEEEAESGKNKRKKDLIYETIWKVLHLGKRSKRIISTATPMINSENEIGSIMNLILPLNGILPPGYDYRNAPMNDIRVLFPDLPFDHKTATPEQIAPYFRGQFPANYDFSNATIDDLEPFFRGRIGFIRATSTGAIPVEQGIPQEGTYEFNNIIYETQLVLYTTSMSDHQRKGYSDAKNLFGNKEGLFTAVRQAANFVFPDGYYGNGITEEEREQAREKRKTKKKLKEAIKEIYQNEEIETEGEIEKLPISGFVSTTTDINDTKILSELENVEPRAFRRYVTINKDNYIPTPEFAVWLKDLSYIRTLSCKYAEIVRLITEEEGNAFVYGELVEGSGDIVLALCLEGMGFVRYTESQSIFVGKSSESVKPVCAGSDRDASNRRIKSTFLPHSKGGPWRYGLLTQYTTESQFQSMMEAMNSYENRHGDLIKALIVSRVGRDGINVNNVLQIHLVGPTWNQSTMLQALARGIRATSHEDLIEEKRQELIAAGDSTTTPQIFVKIYKHAAITIDDDGNEDSIDKKMYLVAEYKDHKIKRIMRIMKQCAIGCQIHYQRNVLPTDVNGSPACDYEECNYVCVDPAPPEGYVDYSTYDVLYSEDLVNEVVDQIINIYRYRNAFTIEEIEAYLPNFRRKYLVMALEQLITNKTAIYDRFGYITYLKEDNSTFYLERSYPVGEPSSYAMSYYTNGVIAIEQKSLADIAVNMELGEYEQVLLELETIDPEDPLFNSRLNDLSIEGQAAILENILSRVVKGEKNTFTDAIVRKYSLRIFEMHEPVSELNKYYQSLEVGKPKRGRKPKPDKKEKISVITKSKLDEVKSSLTYDTNTEVVIIHTLYTLITNQANYATTARSNKAEGRIRLLKPSVGTWRDLNDRENLVYNKFIQIEFYERNKKFYELEVYGYYENGQFKISDKTRESKKANSDGRNVYRGRVCDIWNKRDLIDVLYFIAAPEPTGNFPEFDENHKVQLIQQLLDTKISKTAEELTTWDLNRLIYYFKWYTARKNSKRVLCNVIEQHMIATGRIRN